MTEKLDKVTGSNVSLSLFSLNRDLWLQGHVLSRRICRSFTLRWRHNGRNSVSNHQPHHCLLNRLFRRRSKETSKLRVTGLCVGNSPGTGEFPAQMASYAETVSIWWLHHELVTSWQYILHKQRVLMHGHQGWNVRHGLCHIYMIYVYIWVVYSFCLFCCLFIIVTTQFVALYKPCKPKPKFR